MMKIKQVMMMSKKQVCVLALVLVFVNTFSIGYAQSPLTDSLKVIQGISSDRSNTGTLSPMKKYMRIEFAVMSIDSIQSLSISLGTSTTTPKDIFVKKYLLNNTGSAYLISGEGYMTIVKDNKISIVIMLGEKDYNGKIVTVEAIGVRSTNLFVPVTKNIVLQK